MCFSCICFVCFAGVSFCPFSLPLGVRGWLRKKILITEKKMCGPLSMGQSSKGETKTILFLA